MRDLICANLDLQSVDNEIVLWEPKTKEQSPGEVTQFNISWIVLLPPFSYDQPISSWHNDQGKQPYLSSN